MIIFLFTGICLFTKYYYFCSEFPVIESISLTLDTLNTFQELAPLVAESIRQMGAADMALKKERTDYNGADVDRFIDSCRMDKVFQKIVKLAQNPHSTLHTD